VTCAVSTGHCGSGVKSGALNRRRAAETKKLIACARGVRDRLSRIAVLGRAALTSTELLATRQPGFGVSLIGQMEQPKFKRYRDRVPRSRAISDQLKERAVRSVIQKSEREGAGVAQACREVGSKLGINPNTLRRLVAEAGYYSREHRKP
jgi:hypothetical protein